MNKKDNLITMSLEINTNNLTLKNKQELDNMELIAITDVFDLYPLLKTEFKWTEKDLIELYEAKLLIGRRNETLLSVTKESLEALIQYRKEVQARKN